MKVSKMLPQNLSGKAYILLFGAIFFCVLEVGVALYFKKDLLDDFSKISAAHEYESQLIGARFESSDFRADLWQMAVVIPEHVDLLLTHWQSHLNSLTEIARTVPDLDGSRSLSAELRQASDKLDDLLANPRGTAEFDDIVTKIHATLETLDGKLDERFRAVRGNYDTIYQKYHWKSNFYAAIVLAIGLFFFALGTIVVAIFFSRLVGALRQVQKRAEGIMEGDYGRPLTTDRLDEVGQLTAAINEMARHLEQHEEQAAHFQRRLRQQEKLFAIGTFAAGVAHEIGNPIQAVLALATQVSDSLSEDQSDENIARNIKRIDRINQETDRLNAIVSEIREFSTPATPEAEPVDVNQVIESTVGLLRFDPRFRKISMKTDLSVNELWVMGVADQLVQVVMNPLINAADAIGGADGEIAISSSTSDDTIVVTIADDGAGMPDDVIAHVTEPFFTTKERGKGTGLGLAVCKTIIEEHLGKLEITSAPNKGTTLCISLPAYREEAVA